MCIVPADEYLRPSIEELFSKTPEGNYIGFKFMDMKLKDPTDLSTFLGFEAWFLPSSELYRFSRWYECANETYPFHAFPSIKEAVHYEGIDEMTAWSLVKVELAEVIAFGWQAGYKTRPVRTDDGNLWLPLSCVMTARKQRIIEVVRTQMWFDSRLHASGRLNK